MKNVELEEELTHSSPLWPERQSKVYRYLIKTEIVASCIALVVMFLLIVIQVLSRKVMNAPLNWSEELARFIFIWLVFISATVVMARRSHISVVLFGSQRIGARMMSIIEAFANLLALVGSVFMIFASWALVRVSTKITGAVTDIPMSLVYSIMVVSFALLALHLIVNIYLALRYPEQFEEAVDLARVGV